MSQKITFFCDRCGEEAKIIRDCQYDFCERCKDIYEQTKTTTSHIWEGFWKK